MAQRVRVLTLCYPPDTFEDEQAAISYDSLDILRDHCPGPVLFPALRSITIEDYNVDDCYGLFMSPRLRYVQLLYSSKHLTAALLSMLDTVSQTCDLEELWVGALIGDYGQGMENPAIANTLSRVVLRQTRLKNMSVPSHVSEEALAHLARMPSLEFLRIDFYGAAYRALLNASVTNFSRLTGLELNAALINNDTTALTSFLAAFARSAPVEELKLDFTTNPHDASLPEFFFAVSEFTALQSCHLAVSSRTLRWNGAPVSADILEPLYRVKSMSTLDLSSLPMSVSPDTVRKMATAWPTVRSIHLGQQHQQSTSSLALQDIAPFLVEDCARIRHFGAMFLSETQPGWVAPPVRQDAPRNMTVDVGRSLLLMQDAPRLASVLAQLLPAGKLVASGWFRHERMTETLRTVAQIAEIKKESAPGDATKRHRKRSQ